MEELAADDPADLSGFDHFPDLGEGGPFGRRRLALQEDDVLDGGGIFQAVEIEEGVLVPAGAEQLEILLVSPDARLLKKLPGDGLSARLPGLDCAAGIFPGPGEGFLRSPLGQQELSPSVVDPHADDQSVFSLLPPGTPAVEPPGHVPVGVVDVIEFHWHTSLS